MPKRSPAPDEPDDRTSETASLPERASALIRGTIQRFLDKPAAPGTIERKYESRVPTEIRDCVTRVLESYRGSGKSYRIALICQLAVGVESRDPIDLTKRAPGMRGEKGLAGVVGKFLSDRHIVSVADAYQNVGKNSTDLARGNFPDFDQVLQWAAAAERTKDDLIAALNYCCLEIAKTARPVLPMPQLVSANEWSEKIQSIGKKIRAYDLTRIHIIACVRDHSEMLARLAIIPDDVSVLELRGYFAALNSELRRANRAVALRRLYEHLDRHQSNVELINEYVRALISRGLVDTDSAGETG